MTRKYLLFIAFCIVIPLHAQTGWWGILSGALKAGQALTITDEELAEVVLKEIKAMDQHNTICAEKDSHTQRLNSLTQNMTDADGIDLNFKVYKISEINAFACPDGSVRVFSALMDSLTDDELLGVIGHEIGHVALRHSKRAWQDALLRSAASDAIGAVSETWDELSESYLGDICSAALYAKHSREQENQADEYAYYFLKKCGNNPLAMCIALQKLQRISSQDKNNRWQKWLQAFSSHPDFETRINRMKKLAEKDDILINN